LNEQLALREAQVTDLADKAVQYDDIKQVADYNQELLQQAK
jgi:hypothetical protein